MRSPDAFSDGRLVLPPFAYGLGEELWWAGADEAWVCWGRAEFSASLIELGLALFPSFSSTTAAPDDDDELEDDEPFHRLPWPLSRSVADWKRSAPGTTVVVVDEMKKMTRMTTKAMAM